MIQNRFIATVSYGERESREMMIDRKMFSAIFDSLASTPGGQPFIAEEGQLESVMNLVKIMRGGSDGKGKARNIQCGMLSTEIGKKGREITGPQKAAMELKRMIQEVRITRPEINEGKICVKRLLNEKYRPIFKGEMNSSELWRYNFFIYQLENMKKADYRRMDDIDRKVDMSNLVDFVPVDPKKEFSPLLVNPNLNIELNNMEVLSDAVDSMIEKLDRQSPVLYWLLEYIEERIADDKRWNVSGEIKNFGRNIFDEGYIEKGNGLREKLRDKDCIKNYRETLQAILEYWIQTG